MQTGVRTGAPSQGKYQLVLRRGPRGREVRVEHLKKWAKGKDGLGFRAAHV